MRQILLVDGVFGETRPVPSLGISAITSYVRECGHEVQLFAPNITHIDVAAAADRILREDPKVLGFSLLTRHTYEPFVLMLDLLQKGGFSGFILAGGHFASLSHYQILEENPTVDCIVVGDGEESFAALLDELEKGGNGWKSLLGVACRSVEGTPRFNGPRPTRPLDEYPLMAMDFVDQLVEEYGPEVRVSIASSRGCYADCSYCSVRSYSRLSKTKPYRMRSVQRIIEEIEQIQARHGAKNIVFEDDNFLVPGIVGIRRAKEFRDEIKKRNIEIQLAVQTRPECISKEALELLEEAGLCDIFIGTESFDQDTLDLYHRNNTVDQTTAAFEIFESLGFSASPDAEKRVRVGSMIFHPYVTLDTLYKQAAYFRRYQIPSKKLVNHLFPVEGVELCDRFEAEGLLQKADARAGGGRRNGRYRFVHQEVEWVYDALLAFYSQYMKIREDIRRIEKICRLRQLDVDLEELRVDRRIIEKTFLDLFEELAEQGGDGEARITEIIDKFDKRINEQCDMVNLQQQVADLVESTEAYTDHDAAGLAAIGPIDKKQTRQIPVIHVFDPGAP